MDGLCRMFRSRLVAFRALGFHVGEIVLGCVLVLRALMTVVQYTIKASDHPVDASGCVQVSAWGWDGLFKKRGRSPLEVECGRSGPRCL